MDNKTAKEILGAYRPNGSDALDETFKDALQHAERDPESKAWSKPNVISTKPLPPPWRIWTFHKKAKNGSYP